MSLWIPVAVSALAATGFTALFRWFAIHISLIDRPGVRSSHAVPTPTGGGAVITLTFLVSLVWLWFEGELTDDVCAGVGVGAVMVASVGFWDDREHLSPLWRLAVHVAAVLWLLSWLGGLEPIQCGGETGGSHWWVWPVAAVSLVWLINLYNFMDGIDGIAGVEAVSVVFGAVLMMGPQGPEGLVLLALCLAGSIGGFLIWNWPPARIFMGDVGSGFLGFALGALAWISCGSGVLSIWSWVILLGVFITDATVTLLRRMLAGERWYQAHRNHAYQHAVRRWGTHQRVTVGVLVINVLWLWPWAWLVSQIQQVGVILTTLALAPLVALSLWLGAGRRETIKLTSD